MNVSLTPELDEFVRRKVESGMYLSASEVIREALRLLDERDTLRRLRFEALTREIAQGVGQAERGELKDGTEVFERIRGELREGFKDYLIQGESWDDVGLTRDRSMDALTVDTTTALNQMLEPLGQTLSIEAAEAITALKVTPALQARIQDLADRSNKDLLTEQEQAEYRGYVEGAEILSLLKLKARRLLNVSGKG